MRFPWQRRKVEKREIKWPFDVGPPQYALGYSVESALSLAPVYAATRELADSVASLPLHVYRSVGDRSQRVNSSSLFDDPAPDQTLFDWLYMCMTSLVLQGNAYGLITQRDGFEFPTSISWLPPDLVGVNEVRGYPTRATFYFNGQEIPREDLLHIRAMSLPGCVQGVSPLRAFATLISSGLSATQYGADWFAAGGFPPGTFRNENQTIEHADADVISDRLVARIRSRKPLVYGKDWQYQPITVPPGEAQFVEAARLTATQIAAIYGIPPERIGGERGDSLTYATQEQEEISFISRTLRPWLVRLENAFFGLLPERQYVRFNADAMIRTDLKTRHEVYKIDREIGLRSIDEERDLEELPPVPGGEGADYSPLAVTIAEASVTPPPQRKSSPASPAPIRAIQ